MLRALILAAALSAAAPASAYQFGIGGGFYGGYHNSFSYGYSSTYAPAYRPPVTYYRVPIYIVRPRPVAPVCGCAAAPVTPAPRKVISAPAVEDLPEPSTKTFEPIPPESDE